MLNTIARAWAHLVGRFAGHPRSSSSVSRLVWAAVAAYPVCVVLGALGFCLGAGPDGDQYWVLLPISGAFVGAWVGGAVSTLLAVADLVLRRSRDLLPPLLLALFGASVVAAGLAMTNLFGG